jgi:hypothetical protein
MRMRDLRLLVAAALFCPAVGCNWMKEWRDQQGPGPRPSGKLPDRSANDFVRFVNWRADQFKSVEYAGARMRVSGKGIPIPVNLDGSLAAAQPKFFRTRCRGKVAGEIDMGSNPEQFWVYASAPGDEPLFVFASHTDFESGRAKMPGGLPFEPDWVMQALGMTKLPEDVAYDVQPNDRDRTYTLGWTARSPSGMTVRKEIVLDADPATGNRSQVKRHVLRDAKNKLIATAEVRAAEVFHVGQNQTGQALALQYPTHMVLRWEEPRFELDMLLERAAVNTGLAEDPSRRALFTIPTIRGKEPVDLARFEFPTGRARR